MALGGTVGRSAMHSVTSQKRRKILYPRSKFGGTHAPRVVGGIIQNTKDIVGEDICNRFGHTSETGQKKVDRIPTEKIKR
jgi:hypothetical protein